MKVLELYSGIGGMHLALKESKVKYEVRASVDINTTANKVYKHNFPDSNLLNRNIQSLTSEFINKLEVDTILMSPPCQPFTRVGLQRDVADARTCSFQHLLNILPELSVTKILIENVKGFEKSEMRSILMKSLSEAGFVSQEFILSPTQLGVPNVRHRYYCIAKKPPEKFLFVTTSSLLEHLPNAEDIINVNDIQMILEDEADTNLIDYHIPDKVLRKRAMILDVCFKDSKRSCCFTKAYGRFVEGTGSVFTPKSKTELDDVYKELNEYNSNSDEYLNCLKRLELRFFTPREVCRLMSFPETFSFPDDLNTKQKYMLLGNSVNIQVVSELIKLLNTYLKVVFFIQQNN